MSITTPIFKCTRRKLSGCRVRWLFRMTSKEVEIVAIGGEPGHQSRQARAGIFSSVDGSGVSDDFLAERDQGAFEQRELLWCCDTCSIPTPASVRCAPISHPASSAGSIATPSRFAPRASYWPSCTRGGELSARAPQSRGDRTVRRPAPGCSRLRCPGCCRLRPDKGGAQADANRSAGYADRCSCPKSGPHRGDR